MSDSDLREPSATKITDLKALLQTKRAEHASQVQKIEQQAFESFGNDLNGLLHDAKNAIANVLENHQAALREQETQIQKSTLIQTRRILWMLKLPLLLTATTCLVMIAFCLLWFRVENQERVRMSRWQEGGRTYLVVDDPSWRLCRMGTLDKSKTLKTATVILQPCKPLE